MPSNKYNGLDAEKLAANYLTQHGLKLITSNFHSRFGEIDLIMQEDNTLVFVEVKKRQAGLNLALESITWPKQRKLIKTAQFYLSQVGYDIACRFDAVAIDGNNKIEWLKNVILL
jgi:putative endonuclease